MAAKSFVVHDLVRNRTANFEGEAVRRALYFDHSTSFPPVNLFAGTQAQSNAHGASRVLDLQITALPHVVNERTALDALHRRHRQRLCWRLRVLLQRNGLRRAVVAVGDE